MKKLRLLITEKCNRNCDGCCNKDYELNKLEKFNNSSDTYMYDEIILTGGEPMLNYKLVYKHILYLKSIGYFEKIYMYTAKVDKHFELIGLLSMLDGITVTLHEQSDADKFSKFANDLYTIYDIKYLQSKSLRLNIFEGVNLNYIQGHLMFWKIKQNIKWIKDCPLPKDEVFMKSELVL